MPSSEATRTPATSRKRARCQPSAAASLSLLAVPKLKSCDSVPAEIQTASATGRGKVNGGSKLKAAQPFQVPSKQACKAVTAGTPGDKENEPAHLNQATGPSAKESMPQLSAVQLEQQASMGVQPQLLAKVSSASVVKAMDRVIRVSQQAAVSSPASDTRKSKSAAIVSQNVHAASTPDSQHGGSEVNPDPNKQAYLAMLAPSPSFYAEDEQEHHVGDVPLACQTAIYNRRYCCNFYSAHTADCCEAVMSVKLLVSWNIIIILYLLCTQASGDDAGVLLVRLCGMVNGTLATTLI